MLRVTWVSPSEPHGSCTDGFCRCVSFALTGMQRRPSLIEFPIRCCVGYAVELHSTMVWGFHGEPFALFSYGLGCWAVSNLLGSNTSKRPALKSPILNFLLDEWRLWRPTTSLNASSLGAKLIKAAQLNPQNSGAPASQECRPYPILVSTNRIDIYSHILFANTVMSQGLTWRLQILEFAPDTGTLGSRITLWIENPPWMENRPSSLGKFCFQERNETMISAFEESFKKVYEDDAGVGERPSEGAVTSRLHHSPYGTLLSNVFLTRTRWSFRDHKIYPYVPAIST